MIDYAETHIPAKQSSSCQNTRISSSHGDEERSLSSEKAPRQGTQTSHANSLLIQDGRSRYDRLRNSKEFRLVYETGRRYDSRLMTVFVRPSNLSHHRLGITASRKVSRGAVGRNRLKRLLRETFRLSGETLNSLQVKYDWVINAKHPLLNVKLAASLQDFQGIIARLAKDECHDATKFENQSL